MPFLYQSVHMSTDILEMLPNTKYSYITCFLMYEILRFSPQYLLPTHDFNAENYHMFYII